MQGQELVVIKVKRHDEDTITYDLITIKDDLRDFYEQIECSCIDIVVRRFNGHLFNVICDDEALLREDVGYPTSYYQDNTNSEGLFGTLLLCHDDGNGELISARPDDLTQIKRCLRYVLTTKGEKLAILFHDIT